MDALLANADLEWDDEEFDESKAKELFRVLGNKLVNTGAFYINKLKRKLAEEEENVYDRSDRVDLLDALEPCALILPRGLHPNISVPIDIVLETDTLHTPLQKAQYYAYCIIQALERIDKSTLPHAQKLMLRTGISDGYFILPDELGTIEIKTTLMKTKTWYRNARLSLPHVVGYGKINSQVDGQKKTYVWTETESKS